MSCNEEHHHHGHGHDDNDHIPPPNTNQAQTLYPYIELEKVRISNVTNHDDAVKIIRPYENRLEESPVLKSDVDEEVIIVIPFTGLVKLHSILLRSLGDESSPETIHLFKDKPQLDFDTAATTSPVQSLEYPEGVGLGVSTSEGNDGIVQFAVNRPKFSNMTSLTLHIPSNYGADQTKLTYIGLRGEWTELRKAPVVAQYEAAANPADHKNILKNLQMGSHDLE